MSAQAQPITSGQTHLAFEIGLLLLLSLIWGSSFTLIKLAVATIPPFTMVAARVTIAAMLLILIATAQGHALPRKRSVWIAFFVQGILQSALPFTLISWGELHIASGLAGVLNATPPMFVLVIAVMTGRGQAITGRKVVGAALGLVGVALTIGIDALSGIGTAAPLAQMAVLGASFCYALAPIWGQRFSGLPAIVTAAGAMSCAAVLMLPTAAALEQPWRLAQPPAQAIAAVIALGVVCTALAMVIYFRLIHTLGPLGTTSGSYLRAGCAVALGTAILGEHLTWSSVAGMALILAGVVAVTTPSFASTVRTPPHN
jgi:drug/metabolite transporter (DMT)-like permease